MNVFSILIGACTWYFFGSSISYQKGIQTYGTSSPLAFIVSGLSLRFVLSKALSIGAFLKPSNFENALLRPVPLWVQATTLNAWQIIWSTIHAAAYLGVGIVLGMQLNVEIGSALAVFSIAMVLYIGYGILSSGCILIIKQVDVSNWIREILESLLSGRLFPVSVLPLWLSYASWVLPETRIYFLWRQTLLSHATIFDFSQDFLILSIMTAVVLTLGYQIWRYGVKKCKTEGVIH